jgi:hypothetical protein
MPNSINTYPIQEFIELVKRSDLTKQREIKLDMQTARTLALSIGEVLAKLNQNYDEILERIQNTESNIVEIKMDGGGFK